MTQRPPIRFSTSLVFITALALAGCDRGAAPGADSARSTGSTVQPTPPTASASTPLPVSPAGLTNSSTASAGNDLSNSTRASGNSNVYQPPSGDNPAPGAAVTAGAGSSASSAGQSTSSQTLGTSPRPGDGPLPKGAEGSTASRGGAGKS
ncbi:MAG: hypothetical protein ABIQ33_12210 [Caldimonas sp.]